MIYGQKQKIFRVSEHIRFAKIKFKENETLGLWMVGLGFYLVDNIQIKAWENVGKIGKFQRFKAEWRLRI